MAARWGPPIWIFFHTLIEKVKDDNFIEMKFQLFALIQKICNILPCPDCSGHAMTFLSKVNVSGIRDKNDFRNLMSFFHNTVNKRKGKPIIDITTMMEEYNNKNLINVYNDFIKSFNTNGNIKLMTDNFQRKITAAQIKKWVLENISKLNA
jgi:Zn-finger domain-containing protein